MQKLHFELPFLVADQWMKEILFWGMGKAMGLELLSVLVTVFASMFFGLVSIASEKEQGGWAITGCICTALISIIYAGFQMKVVFAFGWSVEWHRVLLVVLLVGAYGCSIVSIFWRLWRWGGCWLLDGLHVLSVLTKDLHFEIYVEKTHKYNKLRTYQLAKR